MHVKMIFKHEDNDIANGILYLSIVSRLLARFLLLGTIARTKNSHGISVLCLVQNTLMNLVPYIIFMFRYIFIYPFSEIFSSTFTCVAILHLINTGLLWLTLASIRFYKVRIMNEEDDKSRKMYAFPIYLVPILLMGNEYSPTEILTIYTRHIGSAATMIQLRLTTKMREVRPIILLYITILIVSQIANTISTLMIHYLDIKSYFGFIIPSVIQDMIFIYFLIKIIMIFISNKKETIVHLDAQVIHDIPLEIRNEDSRNP